MMKVLNRGYFRVKIVKHTQLLFGNTYYDCWHKDKVGDNILVKKTDWDGAFYEAKTGESILKQDCRVVAKQRTICQRINQTVN